MVRHKDKLSTMNRIAQIFKSATERKHKPINLPEDKAALWGITRNLLKGINDIKKKTHKITPPATSDASDDDRTANSSDNIPKVNRTTGRKKTPFLLPDDDEGWSFKDGKCVVKDKCSKSSKALGKEEKNKMK
jgi:hypothetical protein